MSMSREERRAQHRKALKNEYESGQRRDSKKYLDVSAYKLDKKEIFYKPKEGINYIDILPFIVKTNNHPNKIKPGQESGIMSFWVHNNIGPNKERVLCPKKNLGKPCPICEEQEEIGKNYDARKDEYKALYPKKRFICNVIDLSRTEDKQISQIFEDYAGWRGAFEDELLEEAVVGRDEEEIVTFVDLEFGSTIKFRATEEQIGDNSKSSYFAYKSFHFEKRDPYKENILKKTYPLDEILVVLPYEEIRNIFHGVGEDQNEKDDNPREERSSRRSADKEQPQEKRSGRQRTPEPDDDNEDLANVDEDEKRDRRGERQKKGNSECPHGHKFGEDNDKFRECLKCEIYDSCSDLCDEMNEK